MYTINKKLKGQLTVFIFVYYSLHCKLYIGGSMSGVQSSMLMEYRDIDLAWTAGFIDGEGCLHIMKQKYKLARTGEIKYTHTVRLHIVQNNLEVLEHIRDTLGIHANIHKIKRSIETNRQCYTLNYNSSHAYKAIKLIEPYLVRKRPEARAILDFWKLGKLEMRTGRKPLPTEIWDIREWWYRKLQRMK